MRYFQQKSYINIRYSCVVGEFNVILNLIQNTKIDRKTHLCVCAWVCVSVFVPANGKYTSIRVREDRDKCPTGGCLLSISSYKLHRLLRSYYLLDPRDCGTQQEAVCVKGPENSKFTSRMWSTHVVLHALIRIFSLYRSLSLSNSLSVRSIGNSSVSRCRQKGRSCVVLYWRQDKYRGIIIL